MITGLDHLPIVVESLDETLASFKALLGRDPAFVGRLPGARHAWFQLPGVALDVIAPEGDGPAGDEARARLAKHGQGPSAVGWAVDDVDEDLRKLDRRGLTGAGVGETQSEAEDGRLRTWRIGTLRGRPTGGLVMFLSRAGEPIATATSTTVLGLDHLVVNTEQPDRALAIYGARLGLDLRLDRTEQRWGARFLFFKAGDVTIEIVSRLGAEPSGAPDRIGGLAWRVADADAARERCATAFDVSEVRAGRKPGTRVFTVRDAPAGVPTLIIGPS